MDKLNPLKRVMGILIKQPEWREPKLAVKSQSPKAGHGYSDQKRLEKMGSHLCVKSQSPKAGHGYSDSPLKWGVGLSGYEESQSPKAGHGYSDRARSKRPNRNLAARLNPLKRVMGILI